MRKNLVLPVLMAMMISLFTSVPVQAAAPADSDKIIQSLHTVHNNGKPYKALILKSQEEIDFLVQEASKLGYKNFTVNPIRVKDSTTMLYRVRIS